MDFEYFTITREASIVYQYHSSDDIWEALNLDSNQRPEWSTAYEELHWDKMLGTWTKNEEYLQYTINIESIDLESMSFTCSYDIIESTWGTHHYTGSGTLDLSAIVIVLAVSLSSGRTKKEEACAKCFLIVMV